MADDQAKLAVESAVLNALNTEGTISDSRTLGLDAKLVAGAVRSLGSYEMVVAEVKFT